jgi:hypothetical protein
VLRLVTMTAITRTGSFWCWAIFGPNSASLFAASKQLAAMARVSASRVTLLNRQHHGLLSRGGRPVTAEVSFGDACVWSQRPSPLRLGVLSALRVGYRHSAGIC